MPLSFEDFQATRREEADLYRVTFDDSHKGRKGLVYLDALVIESRDESWAGTRAEPFAYMLQIANNEWLGNDLEELERVLYGFALDDGILDLPNDPPSPAA